MHGHSMTKMLRRSCPSEGQLSLPSINVYSLYITMNNESTQEVIMHLDTSFEGFYLKVQAWKQSYMDA